MSGNHGDADCWVVKLSSTGAVQWQKSLGSIGVDRAYDVDQTTDGGYVVAGYAASNTGDVTGNHGNADFWVVKLNSAGTLQWQKCLGGADIDMAYAVQQTTDGGYIVAGSTASVGSGDVTLNNGSTDFWVVKLNSAGVLQWQKSLGGVQVDRAYDVQQTTDGGYIVAGYSITNTGDITGNHGNADYWVVKLTNAGALQWQKSLGGSQVDEAHAIQQTTDGGYIIVGSSVSSDGDVTGNHGTYADYWAVKINSTGALQWQKSLGGSQLDVAYSVFQTNDGGYIVAGQSLSNDGDVTGNHGVTTDYWLVKLSSAGAIQWQQSLGGLQFDRANAIAQTADGGFVVAGWAVSADGNVSGNHGNADYWVVKLAYTGVTYSFTGSGNWSTITNWSNSVVPGSVLTGTNQIVINPPANGECVLDKPLTVKNGAQLRVSTGKKFRIPGTVVITN